MNILLTIICSGISGVIATLITILVQYLIKKRNNQEEMNKCKFQLWLRLKQVRNELYSAKDRLDKSNNLLVMPKNVYDGFDYISFLSILINELTEDEVDIIMDYYDGIKIFDNHSYSLNVEQAKFNTEFNINSSIIPNSDFKFARELYENKLNELTTLKKYNDGIMTIINKLNIKNKYKK